MENSMEQKAIRKNYWECRSEAELYNKLIGTEYGENPTEVKHLIEQEKIRLAHWITPYLKISPNAVGMEIGTGTGYVIKEVASFSKYVYGCDISESFLNYAKNECSKIENISLHHITKPAFPFLKNEELDFIYSNNVFIHLDLYEITDYLEAVYPYLKTDGMFWFDILDAELIETLDNADFAKTRKFRRIDPYSKAVLQYNSAKTIVKMAQLMNYEVKIVSQDNRCNVKFLLRKLGHRS